MKTEFFMTGFRRVVLSTVLCVPKPCDLLAEILHLDMALTAAEVLGV